MHFHAMAARGGLPFQSRLRPFLAEIRQARRRQWTFRKIADWLREEKAVEIKADAVRKFFRRQARRTRMLAQSAKPQPETKKTAGPDPYDFEPPPREY